jgi:hypothetical protein
MPRRQPANFGSKMQSLLEIEPSAELQSDELQIILPRMKWWLKFLSDWVGVPQPETK